MCEVLLKKTNNIFVQFGDFGNYITKLYFLRAANYILQWPKSEKQVDRKSVV